jgi:hypothetical protein
METTVVQQTGPNAERPKKEYPATPHRWSRWMDGNGKLWIVTGTWRANEGGKNIEKVELLDVDKEEPVVVPRAEYQKWVTDGTLKRIDTPILL